MNRREREERERYIKSLAYEELEEETRKIEEENAFYESLIVQCEAEIAQYHKQFKQMAKDLGYKPFDRSIKLLKKGGEVFGTAKDFSRKWGMPEIDVIESMQFLTDKGALNARVASETEEGEKVYATSLTKLADERPDLIGSMTAEEYEQERDSLDRHNGILSSGLGDKEISQGNEAS